ncbi:RNA polymerase sigma factor [Pareuzebyella sediminis]|uniref:RNA polymerase sigma factor n=1 Tax=Pareuzebyella sediminis TaxID=2607998 RepID=UPI0011EE0DD3|nr:sigma-70 family RNA polymerase sigma factor [Pareuzebyella sediminis]
MNKASPNQLTEHFFRHNHAKIVAILVRYFGLKEVEIAEDIVQDTLIEALEKWSVRSIPDNPEGWLMDVAKKKTINFLKRHQNFQSKIAPNLIGKSLSSTGSSVEKDSTLRMIFTCCHPTLPKESQISLALKTLCGFTVSEIANALLTNESTINKRLYRAKQKFRDGTIAYQIPKDGALQKRLEGVFYTLYLLFNEGYYSSHSEKIIRMDLCFESIRLLEEVIASFPNSQQAKALLALMYFCVARFESRMDEKGAIVILAAQNRKLWSKELIAKGMNQLLQSTKSNEVSSYHLQAGIAAEHCLADSFESTNWESIYQQYVILEKLNPSIIITFNKIIAKFYGINREEALSDLLALKNEPELQHNVHYFTSIGLFYTQLQHHEKAVPFFETALRISKIPAEKALIRRKLQN